jgi:hypothetical protein
MLNDPMSVKTLDIEAGALTDENPTLQTATADYPIRAVDFSDGKTVRIGQGTTASGLTLTKLTISHSVSKENAGIATDRAAVRLEAQRYDSDGKAVTAHVTLVTSFPRLDVFSTADMTNLAMALVGTLISNDGGSITSLDESRLARVVVGEP